MEEAPKLSLSLDPLREANIIRRLRIFFGLSKKLESEVFQEGEKNLYIIIIEF